MASIERTYTVPLRSGFINTPKYYRTNKAMATLRLFLVRHMKVKDEKIRIGQHLNELIWKHGIKNPPPRVTINVKKDDDGIVTAELEGKTYKDAVKPQAKEEAPTGLKERLQAAVGGKDKDESPKKEQPDVRKAPKPKVQKQGSSAHEE
jgi:ribosomal protein L31E